MKNTYLSIGSVTLIIALVLVYLTGCEGDIGSDDCPSLSTEDIIEKEVIEAYHASFFPATSSKTPKNKPAVYVDFSDGITKSCLKNSNSEAIYKRFFKSVSTYTDTEYFELSNDSLIPYSNDDWYDYFVGKGHKTADGDYKTGAPIDKAMLEIVGRDNVSVLITDGELYSNEIKDFRKDPWASKAFSSWFSRGNELFIVYTDFDDTTGKMGKSCRKHMYIMFFVPKGQDDIRNTVLDRLSEGGLQYETLSYSTSAGEIFERAYPRSDLPGAEKYIEYFNELDGYFPSDKYAFEFLDITSAGFNFSDEGLIYYLRDAGNSSGAKENFPLLDHLKFDFKENLINYKDLKLKLVVHDVYDDFTQWKKQKLARENPPLIRKSATGGDTLEPVTNHLIFNCVSTIDGVEPYDIVDKNVSDTVDNFFKILKDDFKYAKGKFEVTDKGIQDFLELDTEAGWNNDQNEGVYEVVVNFSPKLAEANPQINTTRENLFRVDVVLEDAELSQDALNKDALTWIQMTTEGELDEALYISLKNVLEENKPSGVLYSYYIKLGPFNQ